MARTTITIDTDTNVSGPFVVVTTNDWNVINRRLTAEFQRARELEADNARLQKFVDDWAVFIAAHQGVLDISTGGEP